ncbi:MAG: transcriptional regulator [Oceanospirillaceae bacterium]|nr:transcriptional regulator [Oceanospirillaceae bacterium]
MHAEQIKAELRMKGVTSAQIADDLGVKPQTVSSVIHGRGTSARIQNLIAKKIGKQVSEIWTPPAKINRTSAEMRQAS